MNSSTHNKHQRRRATLIFSILVAAAGYLAAATALASNTASPIPSPEEQWAQRSQAIMERALKAKRPATIDPQSHITKAQRQWARDIMQRTQDKINEGSDAAVSDAQNVLLGERYEASALPEWQFPHAKKGQSQAGVDDPYTIRVFTTLGEGRAGKERFINQIEALAGQKHVEVLLRGLPEGMRYINDLMGFLSRITRSVKGAPKILLAPRRYKKANIDAAPTVVFYRGGQALARITGTLEIDWLKQQVKAGKRGMLGTRGPVHAIAERNLMAVIRQRWQAMDWAEQKRHAMAGYWNRHAPTALPEAQASLTFTVDPSIVVARTIKTPRGKVVARKGQHINPLAIVPFTGAVIAFDGRDPQQVKLATALVVKVRAEGLRPLPVTQGLPGAVPSFDAQAKLERTLGSQVYLLDARVIERFNLTALPAVVRGGDGVFVVHEIEPTAALARLARWSQLAQSGESDASRP